MLTQNEVLPTPAAAPPALSVGVVGTGAITKEHLSYLQRSPRARLVAVADLSPVSARYAAERYGAAAWYTSHTEMLAAGHLDVVHVCTPPATHPRLVADCLRAGAHVVCEKPLAPTLPELLELQSLADSRGLMLLEDQNYRWNDPILRLQEEVSRGRVGTVREVEVRMALRMRDGGAFADPHLRNSAHDLPAGPIHDVLTHLVYTGLMLLPQMRAPERVSAHWSNHGADDGLWRWDDLDATLIAGGANLRLRFSAHTRPEGFAVVVRGEQGELATDLFQPYFSARSPRSVGQQLTPIVDHVVNGAGLAAAGARNLSQRLLQHSTYHGLARFLDATYTALQDGARPPLSPADLADTAGVIDLLLATEHRR